MLFTFCLEVLNYILVYVCSYAHKNTLSFRTEVYVVRYNQQLMNYQRNHTRSKLHELSGGKTKCGRGFG